VAGTQADTPGANKLLVMRIANLCKTQEKPPRDDDDSASSSSSDDDDEGDEPDLLVHRIPHNGGVNRVRVMPQVGRTTTSVVDSLVGLCCTLLPRVRVFGPAAMWDLVHRSRTSLRPGPTLARLVMI
jgi:hypothetical protein